jgi:hypothetical protein
MLEMSSAPTSADGGIVNTDRKEVGVPLSVVLQPSFEVEVGVWAAVKATRDDSKAEAWKKLERAMFAPR